MAVPLLWRGHICRRRGGARSRLRLLALIGAPGAALLLAPVVLAVPTGAPMASGVAADLLPSALPSICVGGVVLCPGSVVTLPTSPPVPVPSTCLPGGVCSSDVVGPPTPPPPPNPAVTGPAVPPAPSRRPAAVTSPRQPSVTTSAAPIVEPQPLPAPPGVGIVALSRATFSDPGLRPASVDNLLSLSLRDGLGSGHFHVWPWLLGVQLVLWLAIAGIAAIRWLHSRAASRPG